MVVTNQGRRGRRGRSADGNAAGRAGVKVNPLARFGVGGPGEQLGATRLGRRRLAEASRCIRFKDARTRSAHSASRLATAFSRAFSAQRASAHAAIAKLREPSAGFSLSARSSSSAAGGVFGRETDDSFRPQPGRVFFGAGDIAQQLLTAGERAVAQGAHGFEPQCRVVRRQKFCQLIEREVAG